MPIWRYSVEVDDVRSAKAMMWDVPISRKEAYEIFKILRGMRLAKAKKLLSDVISFKTPLPYTRHKLSIAHKKGLPNSFPKWKSPIGKYPIKACKYILKLLDNVENNALNKGLNTERLVITHAAAHRGPYLKRWMPRAFGRATPKFRSLTHVEVVVSEV
ncbi:MAG: 50S ribosomal protein L22 [Sulfolobales archaeon]|nr:50S ribosomal protein L22 [Sulfolobales archaeon]MCX8186383.1 50S ribosomal protein L22 [Sulfolobales archaeon]MDW7968882.1 50S ribosomal protein L22 [Sulfolobales archaeon]